MRNQYNDEEIAALEKLLKLTGDEVGRASQLAQSLAKHMTGCDNAEHRSACYKRLLQCMLVILDQTRYGAWVEAELNDVRIFVDPIKTVDEIIEQQEKLAAEVAALKGEVLDPNSTKQGAGEKMPETPLIEIVTDPVEVAAPAAQMDMLANAPFTTTKQ